MKINIKTAWKRVRDNDIKALYIIRYALNLVSPRMVVPTLEFFASKYGYKVTPIN